jgi:hypothetical protein
MGYRGGNFSIYTSFVWHQMPSFRGEEISLIYFQILNFSKWKEINENRVDDEIFGHFGPYKRVFEASREKRSV